MVVAPSLTLQMRYLRRSLSVWHVQAPASFSAADIAAFPKVAILIFRPTASEPDPAGPEEVRAALEKAGPKPKLAEVAAALEPALPSGTAVAASCWPAETQRRVAEAAEVLSSDMSPALVRVAKMALGYARLAANGEEDEQVVLRHLVETLQTTLGGTWSAWGVAGAGRHAAHEVASALECMPGHKLTARLLPVKDSAVSSSGSSLDCQDDLAVIVARVTLPASGEISTTKAHQRYGATRWALWTVVMLCVLVFCGVHALTDRTCAQWPGWMPSFGGHTEPSQVPDTCGADDIAKADLWASVARGTVAVIGAAMLAATAARYALRSATTHKKQKQQ